jgi:hypothetical protein
MEKSGQWPERRGFRILGLTYGLGSNNEALIHNPVHFERGEIYTQITNWEKLEYIDYAPGMDSYGHFLDDPDLPFKIAFDETEIYVQGDLSRLESVGKDKRWALLGNIGVWFRYALTTQERHGIYSLHASSIYKPQTDELLIIVGKAGAGKTVFLLESLIRGYQIFSTELTFFRLGADGVTFYRGALMDNIRVGSFVYDFPEAADRLGIRVPEVEKPWDHKISVSMHAATTAQIELLNPKLSFIFPRIEKGYEHALVQDITSPRTLTRLLFESASEKIGSTFLMYEEFPAVGVDTPVLAQARWETVSTLVAAPQWQIKQARTTLAGPHSCMEIIDV